MKQLRCDFCGRFISGEDLDIGMEHVSLVTPLSEFTKEEYETICHHCEIEGVTYKNVIS